MPRAGLNRQKVVALAADIADDIGIERLTLAAIAQRAGVALPSLYKHVEGIDRLHRDLSVAALRELLAELTRAAAGRAGGEALHALARSTRDYARRHPGRYSASTKAPEPGDEEHEALSSETVGLIVDVLGAYQVEGADAIDAVRAFRAAVHGFVSLEANGGYRLAQDIDTSYLRLIDALDVAYTTWAQKGTAP